MGLSDPGDPMAMGVDGGVSTVSGGDPAGGDSRNWETRRRIDFVLAWGGLGVVLDCTEAFPELCRESLRRVFMVNGQRTGAQSYHVAFQFSIKVFRSLASA